MESEFIALTRDGLELYNAALSTDGKFKVEKLRSIEGVESAEWSPQGDLVALFRKSSPQKLEVLDANTWEVLHTVEGPTPVSKFSFSPLGSYLLVCFRFEPNQCPENLRLLKANTAEEVTRLAQRGVSDLSWPPLRWTGGESFMCRLVKGAVHVFTRQQLESGSFSINNPLIRINSPRASAIFASPEPPRNACKDAGKAAAESKPTSSNSSSSSSSNGGSGGSVYCAVFSKETKGEPALLEVYELHEKGEATIVAKKSFFHAQEADCQWAYDGRALLVKTHTDASDLTYYGSSALYFLKCQGGYDLRLVAAEEGPVHAALWSRSTIEFVVCYGKVPATVAMYDGNSKATSPKFRLGEGMRTFLSFCSFSKLLLWGGFGNLAGEVEVWMPRKKGIVGKTVSPSAICQWASCGCFFITANISPRLRVDNRISFFSLSGALLQRVDFSCLYSVQFRPLSAAAAAAAAAAQAALIESLQIFPPGKAPLAPGAESAAFSTTGRSLSALTQSKLGTSASSSSGAYRPPAVRNATPKLPPGAAEPSSSSSSSSRSSRRRQNKKNKGESSPAEAAAGDSPQSVESEEINHQSHATTSAAPADAAAPTPAASAAAASAATEGSSTQQTADDLRRSIRNTRKKLTEIERLKGRDDLNDLQKAKLNNEENLKKQLANLEAQFNALNVN